MELKIMGLKNQKLLKTETLKYHKHQVNKIELRIMMEIKRNKRVVNNLRKSKTDEKNIIISYNR